MKTLKHSLLISFGWRTIYMTSMIQILRYGVINIILAFLNLFTLRAIQLSKIIKEIKTSEDTNVE